MIEKQKEKQHLPAATAFPFGGDTTKTRLRIIFMGTPEFAVASLAKLVDAGCNIIAVVTAPDKPAGRGMEMQQSAVKKYALAKQLPLLQPVKLKDPEFIDTLQKLHADLQVVVAFRMLPEVVWSMPPHGTINLHGSLLPKYRGAAPINWAIINGEKETGVTTFRLRHEIDTGDILLHERLPINEDDNAGDVHDRMKVVGADLLLQTVYGIAANSLAETPQQQSDTPLLHAPKIFTETCMIDWQQPAEKIYDLIRGLSPYPAAFTELQNKKLKVLKATKIIAAHKTAPGKFETDQKTYLRFSCSDGWIDIAELQLEGKKKMETVDFLRGYRF